MKEAAQGAEPGQFQAPRGGNRHIAMNTKEPPFDDINVRRAMIADADREALRDTRGGELVGTVATHLSRRTSSASRRPVGSRARALDFIANPDGDPELAADYMKQGRFRERQVRRRLPAHPGRRRLLPREGDHRRHHGTLEDLGFEVELPNVGAGIMITRFCGVPEQEPQICPNDGWIKDFNDAQSILQPTFSGDSITRSNNPNWTSSTCRRSTRQ